jgi:iron complex outermembrane receptor protein
VSSYEPTNANSVRLTGLELQANAELSPSWSVFGNYAYLRNYDASTLLEQTQYARNSGALGLTHAFGNGWRWSFAYYAASGNGLGESSYGREDLTVSKAFVLGGAHAAASLILRRLDNKTTTYFRYFGDTPESQYDNRLQAYGQLRLTF